MSQMSKAKAEKELARIVAPTNQSRGARPDGRMPFAEFYEKVFLPLKQSRWGAPMRSGFEGDVRRYVLPALGDVALEDLDYTLLQRWLDNLAARDYSESKVKNCKGWVRMMLKEARRLNYLTTNPMEFVGLPQTRPTIKPILEVWELSQLLAAIKSPRDRLIVEIGTTVGLVASELFGLVWECVQPGKLIIRSTAWCGELRPYRVKRKARMRQVAISDEIYDDLMRWKAMTRKAGPGDLVFPGQGHRKPKSHAYSGPACMWPSTFLHFQIQPIARRLGILTPVTFQVLRRSFATHNKAGGKDTQGVMGHSRIETTMNVYAQDVPETERQLVEDYAKRIRKAKPPKVTKGDETFLRKMGIAPIRRRGK
jgi:integrase